MFYVTVTRGVFRLIALALFLSFGLLTACQIEEPPQMFPLGTDVSLPADTMLIRGQVPTQTTLSAMLNEHGLHASAVGRVVVATREVFDPRRLRALQPFLLERTFDGDIRRFEYEIDNDQFLRLASVPGAKDDLVANLLPIEKNREEAAIAGTINTDTPSLYQAMTATGERADLTIAMADIFAGEIDFNTELRQGDYFALAFEKFTREDRPSTYGEIYAAEFYNDGRLLRALHFTPPDGEPGYYDEQGNSLKRLFLKSPLKFSPRVTSGFSRRRFHPVLKRYRPHLGIDYGAPVGAPVVAVATGRVVSATYDSANGRMVRLKHPSGYETYYLHLSKFGPGIRKGARVTQGQLIGQVGATGLATGPHLDYRVRKNGVFVNPTVEHRKMPPGEPVPADIMPLFEEVRDEWLPRLKHSVTE